MAWGMFSASKATRAGRFSSSPTSPVPKPSDFITAWQSNIAQGPGYCPSFAVSWAETSASGAVNSATAGGIQGLIYTAGWNQSSGRAVSPTRKTDFQTVFMGNSAVAMLQAPYNATLAAAIGSTANAGPLASFVPTQATFNDPPRQGTGAALIVP